MLHSFAYEEALCVHAVRGAARATEAAGRHDVARQYLGELLALTSTAGSPTEAGEAVSIAVKRGRAYFLERAALILASNSRAGC